MQSLTKETLIVILVFYKFFRLFGASQFTDRIFRECQNICISLTLDCFLFIYYHVRPVLHLCFNTNISLQKFICFLWTLHQTKAFFMSKCCWAIVNQSAAGSVVFTAWRIIDPLFELITFIGNTVKLLWCKLLDQHTTCRLKRWFLAKVPVWSKYVATGLVFKPCGFTRLIGK